MQRDECNMKPRTIYIAAVLITFSGLFLLYQVLKICQLKSIKHQHIKEVQNLPPTHTLPLKSSAASLNVSRSRTPQDFVKFWTRQNIIGLAHNDPYLIAYIKRKIHPVPPITVPYNLRNGHRKDFSQEKQTVEVKKLFKEKRNGIFVEVGAYDGETFSNTLYWEREYGWTGLLIEPTPDAFKNLLAKHRRAFALKACLSPTNFANVTKFRNIGTGSSITRRTRVSTIYVPCYPFYSIMAAMDFPMIDFFSLDIEGWELNILHTIPFESLNISVLMVEYAHIPSGIQGLTNFMEKKGYRLHKILNIDSIYIKKGVNFSS